jgi:hypothetical protein
MNTVFHIVYSILMAISEITGFTYNEVNVIAYYIVLPFAYVILADKILKIHVLKILYVGAIAAALFFIKDFSEFSDWLFQASVDFLLSFEIFGWSYVVSSVFICVIFPAIVFSGMFYFAYPRVFRALFGQFPKENQRPQDETPA